MTALILTAARRDELARVANELDCDLGNLPSVFGADWQDHVAARARRDKAAERLAEHLRRSYGARIAPVRGGAGGHRVTMLGVTATCTAGLTGALRNWLTAARRRG